MSKRKFSKEFKMQVVQQVQSGKAPVQVAREHDLKIDLVSRWKREYQGNPQFAFSGKGNPNREDTKTAQLERKIGQLYMQIEFVKKVNANLQARLAELKKKK